ncbi:PREDICTED: cadherin-15-like [Tinamus guttatus]|uniref:cadherin-15-like n=1 Tax=Tinamus guttatus TaxID=94827 RepID=UPI00052E9BAF|nr:PREDICTED: cadherin-15-like [Tinamus guttatus]
MTQEVSVVHCNVSPSAMVQGPAMNFSVELVALAWYATFFLLSAVFLWARWKSCKGLNGGVYHVPACHEELEDIRENILNYNEEGGGEQDQDAYNMAELQVSIQTSPDYCFYKKGKTAKLNSIFSDVAWGVGVQEQTQTSATARAAPFMSGDLGWFLFDAVRGADCEPQALPQDSLQVFCTEGEGSGAGSLSTLSSSGLDEETVYDEIKQWGPKFEKLRELYSHTHAEDV